MSIQPAGSLVKYLPLFQKQTGKVALDFGSGNLRNSIFLHRLGYEVYAVDHPYNVRFHPLPNLKCITPRDVRNLCCKIDLALCTFVLNLISPQQRILIFDSIASKMKNGGFLLVETKKLSLLDLDALAIPRGFARVHNQRGRYTHIVLYQFTGINTN
ncbi:MAG: class I SAM-dependent methyltransferase [Thermincola sp.]|jgi:hypothetical protein|nr:class I SAM-dependent methyltransferase [Thermincola sp.]MDT3703915.1 class I SAM-dependent methyltransferase [Thermincola sp.]